MSSSNDNAMTLPQPEPPASQTTLETTTNTNNTTNNNSNTTTITTKEEIDHHNAATITTNKEVETPHHGDKSAGPDAHPTTDNSEGQTCSGIWGWLFQRKREITKTNDKPTTEAEGNDNSGTYNKMTHSARVQKLQEKLKQVRQKLKELQDERDSELEKLSKKLEEEQNKDDLHNARGTLDDINKEIMKFKQHISAPDRLSKKLSLSAADLQQSKASTGHSKEHELVNIQQNQSFRNSSFYNEIEKIFKGLDEIEQFILSCFTVFPENAVVNRRIFVYWGVGEEILALDKLEENTPEKMVDKILEEFQEKGLIEPAIQKRKPQVKSYKMHPLVRSAVAVLSQEAVSQEDGSSKDGSPRTRHQKIDSQRGGAQNARILFDYDSNGNVLSQRDWTSGLDSNKNMVVDVAFRRSKRLCLQKVNEQDLLLNRIKNSPSPISEADLERLVTIFNVSEPFPDLELACLVKMKDLVNMPSQNALEMKEPRAVDWLSKMKDARVICLGSWPGSTKSHIEVESIEFLEGLANSKDLRFLSLQGVSRINKLPESIGNHSNLMILDLKECHNLEVLSGEIAKLTNLVYLDLSDCYLLPAMPKGLSALSKLRVFKGFVISNSQSRSSVGSLHDLKELTKLRKLTINSSSKDFPTDEDLCALQKLGNLQNLTIAWGADPNKGSKTKDSKNGKAAKQVDHQGKAPKLAEKLGRILGSKKLMRCVESQEEHTDPIENAPARQQEVTFKSVTMNNPPTPPILKLKKLDLQCFPNPAAKWLTPDSLPDLEKLYIRGGSLATLDKRKWSKVKILRLKYLREVKMTWLELGESFPKLEYLEKVKCPGITLCPCDEHGVWMNNI